MMITRFLLFAAICLAGVSCGNNTPQAEQEKKMVEEQVNKDQLAMDSLEKAIQAQINAVSDDSLMKVSH
jgi:hypothetical protein